MIVLSIVGIVVLLVLGIILVHPDHPVAAKVVGVIAGLCAAMLTHTTLGEGPANVVILLASTILVIALHSSGD